MDRTPRRARFEARLFRAALVASLLASTILWRGGGRLQGAERADRGSGGCPANSQLVPGGNFLMGTTEKMARYIGKLCSRYMGACQEEWFTVEIPRRSVHLTSFCIDAYEAPGEPLRLPMIGVTWEDAHAWCGARGLRLCGEEEWEKACAGAEGLNWSFGMKYKIGVCNMVRERVARTGEFAKCKSPYGAHDMSGNVAEWVADELDVEAGVNRTRKMHVVKGGSSGDLPFFTRCSSREFYAGDYKSNLIGFRCCADTGR